MQLWIRENRVFLIMGKRNCCSGLISSKRLSQKALMWIQSKGYLCMFVCMIQMSRARFFQDENDDDNEKVDNFPHLAFFINLMRIGFFLPFLSDHRKLCQFFFVHIIPGSHTQKKKTLKLKRINRSNWVLLLVLNAEAKATQQLYRAYYYFGSFFYVLVVQLELFGSKYIPIDRPIQTYFV